MIWAFRDGQAAQGSIVTFAINPASGGGDLYYAVDPTSDWPVVQTEGTTPPLDTWRRDGIRIRLFGEGETPVEEATWGRIKATYR